MYQGNTSDDFFDGGNPPAPVQVSAAEYEEIVSGMPVEHQLFDHFFPSSSEDSSSLAPLIDPLFLQMADHFRHGEGPPHAEDELDIMSLPPRVRPFDPERYHPQEHVLSPITFYHFTNFDRRAPADLLLREPESHLSHQAREPPIEYYDELLGVVASLESMVLRRETQLFIAGVSMPPLQAGPSRPSREVGRGDSTRNRGRHRAPIRDNEESSEEEESAHPQSETSTGRDDDSRSGSEGGGDAGQDSEGDGPDSDGDGAEVA